jgi:hypothetical protein
MTEEGGLDRRAFVSYFSAAGLSGTLFPGALWAYAQQEQRVTKPMIEDAEKVAGLEFTDGEREQMLRGLNQNVEHWEQLRAVPLPNSVVPAVQFDPQLPGVPYPTSQVAADPGPPPAVERPGRSRPSSSPPCTSHG